MSDALLYHGERQANGTTTVTAGGHALDPSHARRLLRSERLDFNWGAYGPDDAALAIALLFDVTGDEDAALAHYQRFKTQFVSNWDEETWTISRAEIEEWLALGMSKCE